MGVASSRSRGGRTTGALQPPWSLQSFCTWTAAKRGIGAVAEAVVTEETGARAIVSWATAGGVNARQNDERGELRRLLRVGVGGRDFVNRVPRAVGQHDFADRTQRNRAGALRRRDGKPACAGRIGVLHTNQHQRSTAGRVLSNRLRQVQVAARGGLERVRTGHGVRNKKTRGGGEAGILSPGIACPYRFPPIALRMRRRSLH